MSDTHTEVRRVDRQLIDDIARRDDGWEDEEFRKYQLARAYAIGLERGKIEERVDPRPWSR